MEKANAFLQMCHEANRAWEPTADEEHPDAEGVHALMEALDLLSAIVACFLTDDLDGLVVYSEKAADFLGWVRCALCNDWVPGDDTTATADGLACDACAEALGDEADEAAPDTDDEAAPHRPDFGTGLLTDDTDAPNPFGGALDR